MTQCRRITRTSEGATDALHNFLFPDLLVEQLHPIKNRKRPSFYLMQCRLNIGVASRCPIGFPKTWSKSLKMHLPRCYYETSVRGGVLLSKNKVSIMYHHGDEGKDLQNRLQYSRHE